MVMQLCIHVISIAVLFYLCISSLTVATIIVNSNYFLWCCSCPASLVVYLAFETYLAFFISIGFSESFPVLLILQLLIHELPVAPLYYMQSHTLLYF